MSRSNSMSGGLCHLCAMCIFTGVLLPLALFAADPDLREQIHLDIYNRDQALVNEIRHVDLDKGSNTLDFHHVASGIYGHTSAIKPLKEEDRLDARLLTYNYDLVSEEKLLARYLNRWFSFSTSDADYHGRLLQFDDANVFLQPDTTDPTIMVIGRSKLTEMYYPGIPEMLYTQPTLQWRVESTKKLSDLPVEISYLTSDLSWACDYRGELAEGDSLELGAVFTISSTLQLDFPSAEVALVAGEAHRSEDEGGGTSQEAAAAKRPADQTRLFEYHRYPITVPVDLFGGQTIQIPFLKPRRIKCERQFVCPHTLDEDRVMVQLTLSSGQAGIDMPLPEGDIGLYQRTLDGKLSFIGEDFIPQTPLGGDIKLQVGSAFDIQAHRTRIAQTRPERDRHSETWRVEITNGRAQAANVKVEQRVYGYYAVSDAQVDGHPVEYTVEDANTISFPVPAPAGAKSALTFTLTYGY